MAKSNDEGRSERTGVPAARQTQKFIPHRKSFGRFFAYIRLLFSLDYTRTDILLIIGGTIFSIAAGLPFPLLGIVFGGLIDDLNAATCSSSPSTGSEISDAVRQKVLYVIYITIVNFCFLYIHCSCWSYASERIARRYRRRYFESITRQEIGYIEGLPAGDVVSRLVSDIEIVQSGTSEKVGLVISTVSYFIASYVVAFIKVPAIAGMLVSVVPCYFFMTFVGGYLIKRYGGRIAEHVNTATSIASSSLSHLTLVHAFNSHERLEKLFADHLSRSRMDALKKAGTHAGQLGLLYFVAYASNSLAFWEGSRLIADSVEAGGTGTSVGAVYTVIFVLLDASFILSQVAPFVHVFASATGASERLLTVINRQSKIDGTSKYGDKHAPLDSAEISFRNVHFTYPSRPDMQILKGVNLVIPPRKHTALVGPSGGGKSTIVALLERFCDPLSGEICIGDQDFRNLNVLHLRSNIGFVQQEPSLLGRSILENIAYGLVSSAVEKHQRLAPFILNSTLAELAETMHTGVTERKALEGYGPEPSEIVSLVREAAESSNALTFIDALPHGLATCVGSSGSHLSGGQKQRIALARALIREPSLLILDEATAALDSGSERLVQEALAKAAGHMTVVSIAHRLATARHAHKIAVIQNGRVVEEGSHAELVAKGCSYAEMVHLQSLNSVVGPRLDALHEERDHVLGVSPNRDAKEALLNVEAVDATDELPRPYVIDGSSDQEQAKATRRQEYKKNTETKDDHRRTSRLTSRLLFSLFRPYMGFILLGLAMSVIIGASYTAEAVIFGRTIGSLSPCLEADAIRHGGQFYGLLFFIMALVELSANVVGGCALGWAADKILYRLRVLSLRSLLGQTIQWHDTESRTPNEVITQTTSDASVLGSITGTTIGLLLATAVNLAAGLVVSFTIAWKIAIVLLPTIPILLVAGMMKLRTQANFAERHQKAFAQATAISVEAVDNIRAVSAFSLEKQSYAEYERALKAPYAETLRSIAIGNVFLATAFSISNLVYALAYWWGTRQIVAGLYSQTQFFIVLPALLFSTQSCGQMFALAPDISKAGVAASNIAQLLTTRSAEEEMDPDASGQLSPNIHLSNEKNLDPEMACSALPEAPPAMSGIGAELQDLYFEYPSRPGQSVLRGLTLTFRPGQFCALVGPSGSGKSTILAMLERFYRPQAGAVVIDGVDVTRQLGTKFRDDIALVPQENVLFEGTVAFNISLGARPGHHPTQIEIEDACRMANIHDVILDLPDGYETQCSHDGKQFSGGQRQRLSIARALIRRPRMLLLDESTSALDVESERRIQEALATLSARTTIVAIAHRLNTIHRADRIFLIEEGCCVEQGTHEELMERSEIYRMSVIHQSLEV